jgi:hypothetical protein
MIHVTNQLGLWSLVGITTLPLLIGTAALWIERRKAARAPKIPVALYRAWAARDEWKM